MVQSDSTNESTWCLKLASCVEKRIVAPNKPNLHEFDVSQREIRDECGSNAETVDKCLDYTALVLTNHNYKSQVHATIRGPRRLFVDPPVRPEAEEAEHYDSFGTVMRAAGTVGGNGLAAYGAARMIRGQPGGGFALVAGSLISLLSTLA